jgi:hypothetical protein
MRLWHHITHQHPTPAERDRSIDANERRIEELINRVEAQEERLRIEHQLRRKEDNRGIRHRLSD